MVYDRSKSKKPAIYAGFYLYELTVMIISLILLVSVVGSILHQL